MSRPEALFIPTSCRHACHTLSLDTQLEKYSDTYYLGQRSSSANCLWAETGATIKSSVIPHLECRAMISQPLCTDTWTKQIGGQSAWASGRWSCGNQYA